jgi:hypothetical protein
VTGIPDDKPDVVWNIVDGSVSHSYQVLLQYSRRVFRMVLYVMARPFYPKDIENSKWLKYYSKVFDYVEIDFSF